jgi:hypothetical protein
MCSTPRRTNDAAPRKRPGRSTVHARLARLRREGKLPRAPGRVDARERVVVRAEDVEDVVAHDESRTAPAHVNSTNQRDGLWRRGRMGADAGPAAQRRPSAVSTIFSRSVASQRSRLATSPPRARCSSAPRRAAAWRATA